MKRCILEIILVPLLIWGSNSDSLLKLGAISLRRIKKEEISLQEVENFLIQAENLLEQEGVSFSQLYQHYSKLARLLREPFLELHTLRLEPELEEFLWGLPSRAEAIMERYEEYLAGNFEKFFPQLRIPFPRKYLKAVWRGQIDFSGSVEEFRQNINRGFSWMERFKNGEINGIDYSWREVPLSSLRMMIDLALREKRTEFLVRTHQLRTSYRVFGGVSLHGIESRFDSFFQLQKALFLFPRNFEQWVRYIILSRENGGGIDPRVIEEKFLHPFIQLRLLKTALQEKGGVFYNFVKRKNFYLRYKFLADNTLGFLLYGYKGPGGYPSSRKLRKSLEIPPQSLLEWNELVDDKKIKVFWEEVKDEHKVGLIRLRSGKHPLKVFAPELLKIGLNGLYYHYGQRIQNLRKELIVPQLAQKAIEEFVEGELDWNGLDKEVLVQAQRELLLQARSLLGIRLSELASAERYFQIPFSEMNGRSLQSLLEYWGSLDALQEGLRLEELFNSQLESSSYPSYATYWAVILVARLAEELGYLYPGAKFSLEELHRTAYEGAFGFEKLESVSQVMQIVGQPFKENLQEEIASRIINKVVNYLSLKKLLDVRGWEAFETLLARLKDRIIWVREMLEKYPPDADSLLSQLRDELEND